MFIQAVQQFYIFLINTKQLQKLWFIEIIFKYLNKNILIKII